MERSLKNIAGGRDVAGIRDRFSSKYPEPLELKYADADAVVNVVELWLQDFYQSHNLVPPNPVFPFEEEKLRSLGNERPAIRQLLKWCRDNFAISAPPPDLKELVQKTMTENLLKLMKISWMIAISLLGRFISDLQP